MIGRHLIKSYSKQQKVIALSSAEAETYALVLASCETLGMKAYGLDLGIELFPEVFADASAALGIIARAGLGKVRHLRTQALWLQESRQEGRLKFTKVPGEQNPADAGTKHMAAPLLEKHVAAMGATFESGRAASAPGLNAMEETEQGVRPSTQEEIEQDALSPAQAREAAEPSRVVRSTCRHTTGSHAKDVVRAPCHTHNGSDVRLPTTRMPVAVSGRRAVLKTGCAAPETPLARGPV